MSDLLWNRKVEFLKDHTSFGNMCSAHGKLCCQMPKDVLLAAYFTLIDIFSPVIDLQSQGRIISTTFGFITN